MRKPKTRIEFSSLKEAIAHNLTEPGKVVAEEDCTPSSPALWYGGYSSTGVMNDYPQKLLGVSTVQICDCVLLVRAFYPELAMVKFSVAPFTYEVIALTAETQPALSRCAVLCGLLFCEDRLDAVALLAHTVDLNTHASAPSSTSCP